ncbi:hypothetical protein Cni_G21003 [Canna indica]|uniref:poly(A)-specific ribonuclease n=1 Tax=Canna indica TaxID=4628 RepID=A0AAQ3KNQ3_9LILI|nr:hypothetical protein Cni_G21003 [Canna indica]
MPLNVQIRQVWSYNLAEEFALIRDAIQQYHFVAMDTEFPGVIFRDQKHYADISLAKRYLYLKINVDVLCLIQVGLTLFDADGNLPTLGVGDDVGYVWEFNFRDFNLHRHAHSPAAIELLKASGINFDKNHEQGVDSATFAGFMLSSGLVCNEVVTWVTFHGAYDFAYLVKILTSSRLPETLEGFMDLLRFFFGTKVFDAKMMMRYCDGLYGGLEQVASLLKVNRMVGQSHQAGSDSLLTCQTFLKMKENFFEEGKEDQYAGVLYGLDNV